MVHDQPARAKSYLRAAVMVLLMVLLSPTLTAQTHKLLIIGDSLSDAYDMPREAGWAWLLSERLGPDWQVINAAISGETTAGAAYRTPELLERHQPDHVLVILGGNDGLRALGPRQVRSNLESIIGHSQRSGARVALMQLRLPASLGPVYIRRFEAIYPELSEQYELELLPFFLEDIFARPGMIMPDGIHPTEAAQPLMLESISAPLLDWLGKVH